MDIHPMEISILSLDEIINNIGAGGLITQYLMETWYFLCEDPRDRVFSLISLVDWALHAQTPLLPDYSMTSFQLALQLMSRLVDLNVEHVFNIVVALDLDWQYSEDIQNEIPGPHKVDRRSTTRQKWTASVDGAYLLQKGPAGRLQVNLRSSRTEYETDDNSHHRNPKYDYEYLATKGIVSVFADGGVVALACGPICWGDILLIGEHFSLVLRACSNASNFVVVGAAFTPTLSTSPGT